ncbi:hypothetical protein E8E11_003662 [Didymella keratinophila]|nr:hypothetical protein E8E11_003662 [Didymella keratinophila]
MGNCIAIFADPASMFNLRALEGTRQELAALLSGSSYAGTDGFDIQVGRSINARTVRIPLDVLDLCPTLNDHLIPGCRIVNADPVVLAIVIEHLQTISVFGFMSISASGRQSNLASGKQSLLKFAKTWHVLDMLRMPELQNKLLEIYRRYYLKCLKRVRHQLQPLESTPLDSEPYVYLRNNLGNHSKAEKFLVDFHAGLMRYQRQLRLSDLSLLPPDIRDLITDRWLQLCGRARKDSHQSHFNHDRIAAGNPCYKVTQNEAIEHSVFQIQLSPLINSAVDTSGYDTDMPEEPVLTLMRPLATLDVAKHDFEQLRELELDWNWDYLADTLPAFTLPGLEALVIRKVWLGPVQQDDLDDWKSLVRSCPLKKLEPLNVRDSRELMRVENTEPVSYLLKACKELEDLTISSDPSPKDSDTSILTHVLLGLCKNICRP